MDAQRALLDELMGLNRNQDNPDAEITDYKDKRVCKNYLCGLCPHEVFSKTKNDVGPCEGVHDDSLKKMFEETKGPEEIEYEIGLEKLLREYVHEIDKKIAKGHKRLEGEGGEAKVNVDVNSDPEVLKLQAEIQETLAKAEAAGEEGDVDEAQELMEKVEKLQQEKAELQGKLVADAVAKGLQAAPSGEDNRVAIQDVNQKLRVCEVCGAFLSISDNDRRLADHFGGKVHLGYAQIRDKLKELQEKRSKRDADRRKDMAVEPARDGDGRGPRDRDYRDRRDHRDNRDRSRRDERDRHTSTTKRSRSRSRDRGRKRDRSRERDRRRSRSRSPYRRRRSGSR